MLCPCPALTLRTIQKDFAIFWGYTEGRHAAPVILVKKVMLSGAVMPNTSVKKPRCSLHGVPDAFKAAALKYLMQHDKLCKHKVGVQKLDWLKINTFRPKQEVFHNGKAIVRQTIVVDSQQKIRDERFKIKRDLLRKQISENEAAHQALYQELQALITRYVDEQINELKVWNVVTNDAELANKLRGEIAQKIVQA